MDERHPPEDLDVRLGSSADIPSLEPLWLHVHDVHQRSAPELGPWVSDEETWSKRRELYEHCLSLPDSFVLLAERGPRLVGYALVTVEPDGATLWNDSWVVGEKVAELESISVLPDEEGQGIGTALLDAVDRELELRGIGDLVIGAVPGNPAIDFYRRRGFVDNWVILSRFASRRAGSA